MENLEQNCVGEYVLHYYIDYKFNFQNILVYRYYDTTMTVNVT